jgi:hypothetical protein
LKGPDVTTGKRLGVLQQTLSAITVSYSRYIL